MTAGRTEARRKRLGNALVDFRRELFALAAEVQDMAISNDGDYEDVVDWMLKAAFEMRGSDVFMAKAVEALQAAATKERKEVPSNV